MADRLFLLLEGAVNVYAARRRSTRSTRAATAATRRFVRYDGGAADVGEILWANKPPNASVVATEPTKLLARTSRSTTSCR